MDPGAGRTVRVAIIDDHHVVRIGLRALLEAHPGICVAGEAANGRDGLAMINEARPDVVLLDMRLPDADGLEICRRLKKGRPSPAVLILTSFADDRTVLGAIEAGADGYLLKQALADDIPSVILTVAGGGSVLDPLVTRKILQAVQKGGSSSSPERASPDKFALLSKQEMRVIELAALGRSNKQLSSELQLSDGTVRNYLSSAFAKLGVQSRGEAAFLFFQRRAAVDLGERTGL
jgi:DNA-binding NarL/FixJ family response regulator